MLLAIGGVSERLHGKLDMRGCTYISRRPRCSHVRWTVFVRVIL